MATHTHTTGATAIIWPDLFGRIADIPEPAPRPDADLLTLCAVSSGLSRVPASTGLLATGAQPTRASIPDVGAWSRPYAWGLNAKLSRLPHATT